MGAEPWTGDALTFPAGEASKTREQWARLTDALLAHGFGRDSGIIALGGGVAGDLAGFVAATYMRGLPYLQVPTSLLAMLDASVGGKTGRGHARRARTWSARSIRRRRWWPTRARSRTLPERDYRGGMAEAVKHGLIADAEYFAWMEREADALLRRDEAALTRLVRRSVEIKAEVVSGDEREAGRRAILNAGHTVAHALEQVDGLRASRTARRWRSGLVAECALAEQLGLAAVGRCATRVAALLEPPRPAGAAGPADRSRPAHRGHGDATRRIARPACASPCPAALGGMARGRLDRRRRAVRRAEAIADSAGLGAVLTVGRRRQGPRSTVASKSVNSFALQQLAATSARVPTPAASSPPQVDKTTNRLWTNIL